MSIYGDKAYELFTNGANCAQATLGAFADELGMQPEFAAKLASGFGGGLGRQREVCGAVSGICMAAGVLRGYSDPAAVEEKAETYERIRALCARFAAENGSILCRELLGFSDASDTAAPEARTEHYYATRPCGEYCRTAADILAAYLEEHPE